MYIFLFLLLSFPPTSFLMALNLILNISSLMIVNFLKLDIVATYIHMIEVGEAPKIESLCEKYIIPLEF